MNAELNTPGPVVDRESKKRSVWAAAGSVLIIYVFFAYLMLPSFWRVYVWDHPSLKVIPNITHTSSGIPGDPLNVSLIGTEEQLQRAMLSAGWHPADPITLRSSLKIAATTILRRPYADAPVSSLYLFNRKQDLAFEKEVGNDPRRRHHVRFWKAPTQGPREYWVGAATFDRAVGISRTTGQVTHHIAPNVDEERDQLFEDLKKVHAVEEVFTAMR